MNEFKNREALVGASFAINLLEALAFDGENDLTKAQRLALRGALPALEAIDLGNGKLGENDFVAFVAKYAELIDIHEAAFRRGKMRLAE